MLRFQKPGGMNVSTVFPEGYVENERAQRHASAMTAKEEGEYDMERYRRKF
ncbi:hypothetical protein EAI_01376 [Harpegnathos saltator]|uniref:Uncharacterized protein n=1 Tax=Harpegnathos saltator TaxID=610380 RepID=E2B787_HARSA|nr:hypothetical protein EAI_01376 [Harpegnathos saltator]